MKSFLRVFVGLILGAILGAVFGAVMLTVPTYFDDSCGFLGCARDWRPIAIFMGVVIGGVPGGVIGLIVAIVSANRLKSTIIGANVGLAIALSLIVMGAGGDGLPAAWAILAIPAAALVGLIVGALLRWEGPRIGAVPIASDDISPSEPNALDHARRSNRIFQSPE